MSAPQQPEVTSSTCFVDPVWLAHNGGVRPENALDYFERSPFFARGEGVEFELRPSADPRCVVISRKRRRSARVADAEGGYYVLQGTIFQQPTVDEVARSRLRKCSHQLSAAFAELRAICTAQEAAAADAARDARAAKRRDDRVVALAERRAAALLAARAARDPPGSDVDGPS